MLVYRHYDNIDNFGLWKHSRNIGLERPSKFLGWLERAPS